MVKYLKNVRAYGHDKTAFTYDWMFYAAKKLLHASAISFFGFSFCNGSTLCKWNVISDTLPNISAT